MILIIASQWCKAGTRLVKTNNNNNNNTPVNFIFNNYKSDDVFYGVKFILLVSEESCCVCR